MSLVGAYKFHTHERAVDHGPPGRHSVHSVTAPTRRGPAVKKELPTCLPFNVGERVGLRGGDRNSRKRNQRQARTPDDRRMSSGLHGGGRMPGGECRGNARVLHSREQPEQPGRGESPQYLKKGRFPTLTRASCTPARSLPGVLLGLRAPPCTARTGTAVRRTRQLKRQGPARYSLRRTIPFVASS